jgi:hypothetical protein
MTVLSVAFAVGAFLCGVRTMGYWVILQVGGVRPAGRGGIALVGFCSTFLFVILSSASACFRERRSGARAALAGVGSENPKNNDGSHRGHLIADVGLDDRLEAPRSRMSGGGFMEPFQKLL